MGLGCILCLVPFVLKEVKESLYSSFALEGVCDLSYLDDCEVQYLFSMSVCEVSYLDQWMFANLQMFF